VNAPYAALKTWRESGPSLAPLGLPLLVIGLVVIVGLAIAALPISWAVTVILAGGALLLILLRPIFGLYLLVLAIPFGSLKEINLGVLNIGGAEAVAALTVSAWVLGMLARREVRTSRPALLVPILLLLAVLSFSVLGALSLQWSIKGLLVWLELAAVYLLVVNMVKPGQARLLVVLILAAGCLEASLGIYQFFGRVGPEGFVLFDRFMRAYGTFQQPNPFGGYLVLILPLSMTMVMGRWSRRDSWAWLLAVLGALSMALMGAALVMSWSRGAWLAFGSAVAVVALGGAWTRAFSEIKGGMLAGAAGGVLGLWWSFAPSVQSLPAVALGVFTGVGVGVLAFIFLRRRWLWALATLVLLLVVMVIALGGPSLLPESVAQRFSDFLPYLQPTDVTGVHVTDENFAVVERLAHWEAALRMISDHPLLGVGIGNYVPVYPAYAVPGWKDPLGHAHNYYLNVAAEAGLLGLGAYVLFLGASFHQAWLATRRSMGFDQAVALGVLGVLAAFSVHSLFDNLYVHGMNMHLAMLLALLSLTLRGQGKPLVKTVGLDSE
jgi:putative inorganic carbon (HCO3(-)) transporter